MSSLMYFELPIITVGTVNPENYGDTKCWTALKPEKSVFKKILLKDGVIVGFIFLGELDKVEYCSIC